MKFDLRPYRQRAITILRQEGLLGLIEASFAYIRSMISIIVINVVVKSRYVYYRMKRFKTLPDPFALKKVDPDDIEYYLPREYNMHTENNAHYYPRDTDVGRIKAGNWDRCVFEFESLAKYRALAQRHNYSMSWEETGIIDYLMTIVDKRGQVDGCTNQTELKERYNRIDDLYKDVRDRGYRSQKEMYTEKNSNTPNYDSELKPFSHFWGEPAINIGRNGELIFGGGGGTHRISIAKLLDVNEITVRVILRHEEWHQKREMIESGVSIEDLDVDRDHPDIQDICH